MKMNLIDLVSQQRELFKVIQKRLFQAILSNVQIFKYATFEEKLMTERESDCSYS